VNDFKVKSEYELRLPRKLGCLQSTMVHILAGSCQTISQSRTSRIGLFHQKPLTSRLVRVDTLLWRRRQIAHRLCARFQIHDSCKVQHLSPTQITALAAFLSSPSAALAVPKLPLHPLRSRQGRHPRLCIKYQALKLYSTPASMHRPSLSTAAHGRDPLRQLKVETELKREMRRT